MVDADFENPDGTPLTLDTDYFNIFVEERSVPGSIGMLVEGRNNIKV